MPIPIIAAVGAGLGLVSTAASYSQSRKANKANRRANALAQKRANIQNIYNQRSAAAAVRRQQAQQALGALSTGMYGGSADFGTASSIEAQGVAAVGQQQQMIELGADINYQVGKANRYSQRAQGYQALGSLAGQAASLYSAGGGQ